ncbi:MAG: universal stress protein [Geminicoccaceae bacterium]
MRRRSVSSTSSNGRPTASLTPDELATRHKRRNEEVARATAILIQPIAKASEGGVHVEAIVRYGHAAEVLCDMAKETGAVQIFVGRGGSSHLSAPPLPVRFPVPSCRHRRFGHRRPLINRPSSSG